MAIVCTVIKYFQLGECVIFDIPLIKILDAEQIF